MFIKNFLREVSFFPFFFLAALHGMQDLLVPQPGTEPAPSAVEVRSLNHWTAREVPSLFL